MSVRPFVEEYVAAGATVVSCEEVRQHVADRAGYPASGMAVSRVLGNLGWERFLENGKVHFRQPSRKESP